MDFARRIHCGVTTSAVESAVLSGFFRARYLSDLRSGQPTLQNERLRVCDSQRITSGR
jgi:hypothetical protein